MFHERVVRGEDDREDGVKVSAHRRGHHRSTEILDTVATALSVEVIDGIVHSFNKYFLSIFNEG